MIRCIGVDLGWTSGATGLALMEVGGRSGSRPHFVESAHITPIDQVVDWIRDRSLSGSVEDCVVAVDAPLRIRNESGMRACERQAHRLYGRFDAGCYPANLGRPFAARTIGVAASLESMGFRPASDAKGVRRQYFECFPHISSVEWFGLDRILKYKKGRRADRRVELSRLRDLISTRLDIANLRLPDLPDRGPLKPAEDQLDAILCAYSAYYWWRWGFERNRILGDMEEGCIITPTAPTRSGLLGRTA